MHNVGDKVKMHKGGMCSTHKSQMGTIIRVTGKDPRPSYFIQFDDGKIEIHRKDVFDLVK